MSGALRRRVERLEAAAEDVVQTAAQRMAARYTAGLFALVGDPVPADLLELLRGDTPERAEADRRLVDKHRQAGGRFSFLIRHEDWIDRLAEAACSIHAGSSSSSRSLWSTSTRSSPGRRCLYHSPHSP